MQFLACDRYKGSSSEENSLLPRSRPSFKDYFHVRPSAFRWWKDTRFNQVNATTRPTPTLVSHCRLYVSTSTCTRLTRMSTCTRGITFMCNTHFGNGATVYTNWNLELPPLVFSTRACFLQIGFKKNVRSILESLFQRMANEATLSRRAFHVKKNTQHSCASCVFQQILSDVKDDALRDRNVCHDVCNPNFGQIAYSYAMTAGQ